ncbi:MAG: hypothetical protein K6G80_10495 [Treponema sp.]|nr:hypothetical protein [Treponema sp.]
MKPIATFTALLSFSAVLFMSCLSTRVDYAARSEERTPENSAVMVYIVQEEFDLVQINPDFAQDRFTVQYGKGFTPPVENGSCYLKVYRIKESDNWAGAPCITGSLPFSYLNAEQGEHFTRGTRLVMPTEPGLHLVYFPIDIEALKKETNTIVIGAKNYPKTLEELKKSMLGRHMVLKSLRKALKSYAGTAWEPVINEKIQEWENAKE